VATVENVATSIIFSPTGVAATSTLSINYPGSVPLVQTYDAFIIQLAFTPVKISSGACVVITQCTYRALIKTKLIIIYPGTAGIISGSIISLSGFTNPSYVLTAAECVVFAWALQISDKMNYKSYSYAAISTSAITSTNIGVTLTQASLFTTEINQFGQYSFDFTFSSTSIRDLTKVITLLIPSLTIISSDCMASPDTLAEISLCNIDKSNNVMTINIFSFHAQNSLKVMTRFKGVLNPSTVAELGAIEFHIYAITNPTHSSDEGIMYKNTQDSHILTTNSLSPDVVPKPYYLEIMDLPYQDRIYSLGTNYYFYLKFVIKPTASISAGSLKIKYNTIDINFPSSVAVNDINDNELLCLVDEVRKTCSRSGDTLTISSVTLTTTATYRISIGVTNIYSTPAQSYVVNGLSAQSTKYHTDFQVSLYDSSSILVNYGEGRHLIIAEKMFSSASIKYMTSVKANKNIISVSFTPVDVIDTLMFEFPTLSDSGQAIFDLDLGGFLDGGQFPCETLISNLQKPYCYLKIGDNTVLGSPTYVVMRGFTPVLSVSNEFLLVGLTNPSTAGVSVSLKIYGYLGSVFKGYQEFENFFITQDGTVTLSSIANQFIVQKLNTKKSATMTLGVSIPANTYILVEDKSTGDTSFQIDSVLSFSADSGTTTVRKTFGSIAASPRSVFYALKYSVTRSSGTYPLYNVLVKDPSSNVVFHHYSNELTGEIKTTNIITGSPYIGDCIMTSSSPLEIAILKNQITPGILKLSFGSSISDYTFNDGNIIVITLANFAGSSLQNCYIIDGLTATYSYIPIVCTIVSSVLTITGWNGIISANFLKIYLEFTANNLGGTGGTIKVDFYYNSNTRTNSYPYISSTSSAITWPVWSSAAIIIENSFISNLVVDLFTKKISFRVTPSSITVFDTIILTLGSEFLSISTTSMMANSYYQTFDGTTTVNNNFASITKSASILTIKTSSSINSATFTTIDFTLIFDSLTFPIFNIAFLTFELYLSSFVPFTLERVSIVKECFETTLTLTAGSLSKNANTLTEIYLNYPNFDSTKTDTILIELDNNWSFSTTSTDNDFPIPCISSDFNVATCYAHKSTSTGFPKNSITIHSVSSGSLTYYISKLITSTNVALVPIIIKYIRFASFVPLSSYISSSRTQILYIDLTSPAGSDSGTLAIKLNTIASPYTTIYTGDVVGMEIKYTLGAGALAINDIIYIVFSDFSSFKNINANLGSPGVTTKRIYKNPDIIIANTASTLSSVTISDVSTSSTLAQKTYRNIDYLITAFIYRNGVLFSSASTTINANILEASCFNK